MYGQADLWNSPGLASNTPYVHNSCTHPSKLPSTPTAVNFTSTIPLMQVRWTLGMFGRALIFKESTLKLERERKIAIRMARNLILCTPHL